MERPLLVYDGRCSLCTRLARRWAGRAAGALQILPSQAEQALPPDLDRERLSREVALVVPGGRVLWGAEATLAVRALGGRPRLLALYRKSPLARATFDLAYSAFARHRRCASRPFSSGARRERSSTTDRGPS